MNQPHPRLAMLSPHVLPFLGILVCGLAASSVDAVTLEQVALEAEASYADGRWFEASGVYRELLTRVADLAPESREAWLPEAELALFRLDELRNVTGECGEVTRVLERAAAWNASRSSSAAAQVGAFARHLLGYGRLACGAKPEEAEGLWKPLGFLAGWKVIGPFDNERGRAFLTEYPPEKEIALDASYDGKKRPVRWRSLPARPVGGYVNLAELLVPAEEALAYAVTFIRSEADQALALGFGTDEGFRVWVNGVLAASADVRRSLGFDQNVVGIRLHKGWNSILFKVTQSTDAWELRARLSSLDGSPATGVVEGDSPPGETPPPATASPEVPTPAPPEASTRAPAEAMGPCDRATDGILRKRIEESPADARPPYLLGALLYERRGHDDNEHPDTEQLKLAVERDGTKPIYEICLARSHKREATIAAQKDDNAWRLALEKASQLGSALSDLELADYYFRTFGSLARARSLVLKALERNPTYDAAILLGGEIEQQMGFPGAREKAVGAASSLARKTLAARLERVRSLRQKGKASEARELLREALLASSLDGDLREDLCGVLADTGSIDEATAAAEVGAGLDPLSTRHLTQAAERLVGRDRLEDGLVYLERAWRIRPEDHGIIEKKARLLLRLGKKDDALAAMDLALSLQPNLPAVREYAEFLRAQKSTFEDDFRRDLAGLVREALASKPANEGQDPARILFDATAIDVNRDGTTKTFEQKAIQILNDAGIRTYDRFGTFYASGDQVLEFKRATVHHPDGTSAEAKLSRHGGSGGGDGEFRYASVDLPPLSPGDVIEVELVREDVVQSFFGDYFGHREVFQEQVPVGEKVFMLRVPEERKVYFHRRNLSVEPATQRNEEKKTVTYTWQAKDLAKLEPEPAMPDRAEVSPVLEISTFQDWDHFNNWYWNLIKEQFEVSPEISKKVKELTSGAATDVDRIRAIYNFVVMEVRYNAWEFGVHGFKPYNAATIFTRRFGDCKDKATLLSVMLKEVGIEARPVLIEAADRRGNEDLTLPMVNHFNHCITYLPGSNGREELYLDGTAQFHGFRELPSMDRGAKVLIVKQDAGAIQQVPWNEPGELAISEEATVVIQKDLTAVLEVRASLTGDYAVYCRQAFEIPEKRRLELEKMYGRRFAEAKVKDEKFSNLADLNQPVSLAVTVAVPRFVAEAPEGLVLRVHEDFLSTAETLAPVASLEKRAFDVLLGPPRRSTLKTVYILPEGFKVKSLPPPQDVSSRFGRLRIAFEEPTRSRLIAHRLIELTSPRITTAEYAEFRDFASSIGRLDDEKIVLERS